jgi:hypothetical protein
MQTFKTTLIAFVASFLISPSPVAPGVTTSTSTTVVNSGSALNSGNAPASAGYVFSRIDRGMLSYPEASAGYAPLGIAKINGRKFAVNCFQNGARIDDVAGPGRGFADIYDSAGVLVRRFTFRDNLNSPPQITEYVSIPTR